MTSFEDIRRICEFLETPRKATFGAPTGLPLESLSVLATSDKLLASGTLKEVTRNILTLSEWLKKGHLVLERRSIPTNTREQSSKPLIEEVEPESNGITCDLDAAWIFLTLATYIQTSLKSAVWTNPETSVAALGAIQLLIGHLQITDSTTDKDNTNLSTEASRDEAVHFLLLPGCLSQLQKWTAPRSTITSELDSVTGCDAYTRAVGAHKLRGWLHVLNKKRLEHFFNSLLPITLAYVEDSNPAVQAIGIGILHQLVQDVPKAVVTWQRSILLQQVKQCLAGCPDESWDAAAHFAVDLVCLLEGGSPQKKECGRILDQLLGEVQLKAHVPTRRLVWLSASLPLVKALRISVVEHFSKMMPLLLQWCGALDSETRVATLAFLIEVVHASWPRIRQASLLLGTLTAECIPDSVVTTEEASLQTELGNLLRCLNADKP